MREAIEMILRELEVPRSYIAYPCLLRMAERYALGESLGPDMLLAEAQHTGHTYSALRKSLYRIAWTAYSHPNGRLALGSLSRQNLVWSFVEAIFPAAEKKNP